MEEPVAMSLCVSSTDYSASIGLEIWLDNQQIFNSEHLDAPTNIQHTLSDIESEHVCRIIMKNKTHQHTRIDQDGNILSDVCLTIDSVKFDVIDITEIFLRYAKYHHDFNGTRDPVDEECYGHMGCNGTLELKFTTPVYLWLLENL